MAFKINKEQVADNDGNGDFSPEEKWIPAGDVPARLIGVIELGMHVPTFGVDANGIQKPAVYDTGARTGQVKDPCFEFQTMWATGCEHTGPDPLYLLNGDYDRLKISDYQWADPSKLTNKTNFFKSIMLMDEISGIDGCCLTDFIGMAGMFPVTNKDNSKSKIEGMQYANTKLLSMRTTKTLVTAAIAKQLKSAGVDKEVGEVLSDEAADLPMIGTGDDDFKQIVFSWENPTEKDYRSLKPWHRKRLLQALNLVGSPLEALLTEVPELKDLDKRVDKPADEAESTAVTDTEEEKPVLQGAAAALLNKATETAPEDTEGTE